MSNYRRSYVPGGVFFLTIVTYRRIPLFSDVENISRLRKAMAKMRTEKPFDITAAVVLPDHLHFIWSLPPDDSDYSQRVSRLKVLFTRSLPGKRSLFGDVSPSRRKHRESNVWQRRFWEHTIRDDHDLHRHLDYIHYNPVKHGLVSCPHLWEYSSFHKWVERGKYRPDWGCCCGRNLPQVLDFSDLEDKAGE
ncbi:MAG: transposase [Moorea sp. SIO1G6]|uniref:REP-associated tyrosine transposase n=1 Tax=Moorena sp. SIO1G6 TaxID=2607840 RepID=UPI0013C04134|nr:transposase [Moorena sp. SIO1G6]NET66176.1 transposase [Moorena sp. SIO1G6]